MDQTTAANLSKRLQISQDKIVQEEYEMLLLKEIYESDLGPSLVFKGGTALRLVYGSPRFSEDLDFTAIRKLRAEAVFNLLKKLTQRYPNLALIETREKFYTIFAKIKIKEDFLERPFSIKLEISKRDGALREEKDFSDKIIKSDVTIFTVLVQTASLKRILQEKESALKTRRATRDVFDFWFIHQLLGKTVKADFSHLKKELVKAELHRLLPKPYWRQVDEWLKLNPKTQN